MASILHPDNKGQPENGPVCSNVRTNLWLYILSAHQYEPLDKNTLRPGYYFSAALVRAMNWSLSVLEDRNGNLTWRLDQNKTKKKL